MRTVFWAAAVCLAAATAGRGDDALPPELDWIPTNSVGFVHVRFHDLWTNPALKAVLGADPKALDAIERQLGIPASRIDRVTILLPAFDFDAPEPGFVIRITTTRPYKRADVLAAMKARDGDPTGPRSQSGLVFLRDHGVVHFGDERTLTLIPNEDAAIGMLSKLLAPRRSGPLSAALRLAAGKSTVVASLDQSQLPRIPAEAFPPDLRPLRPLIDAKTLTLIGNLDADKANLELRLAFDDRAAAAEGKQAAEEGVKALRSLLVKAEKDLGDDAVMRPLLRDVQAALLTANAAQTDAGVSVTMQAQSAETIGRLVSHGARFLQVGSARAQSQNNLKQMVLAFHNYHDTFGRTPAAAICDKNGKPLLSWRVAILPYIEQDNLYKQFHLDEPWDSDHNKKLIPLMPKTYALPGDTRKYDLASTYYQTLVGEQSAFDLKNGRRIPADFPDGTSYTVMVVEAADPVVWTKPDDIAYDLQKMPPIGFYFGDTTNTAFADGSVRSIRRRVPASTWHLLIQRADGMVIPSFED